MVIDTGIFIEHLRAKDKRKTSLYNLPSDVELFISSVSLYELYMGATTPEKEKDIELITEDISILPFSDFVAVEAAKIYHQLRISNKLIEFRDIFIAATCLANDLPLVTLNKKHFIRIKGLTIF
ncbi:MAG TPA: type II toxin-antitoxin system VapC family toxin [Mucilaginibacter sp.]|jgi:tRNA(fMet)-specific endonuclease VapC|nr:type II toxin-antitoxin system VapC family toxin [Mucilaginibacter sp.]